MWPQYVYLLLVVFSLSVNLVLHGEEKSESGKRYNFGVALINASITFSLLYAGGFFDKM
jgi:hypothetical protein